MISVDLTSDVLKCSSHAVQLELLRYVVSSATETSQFVSLVRLFYQDSKWHTTPIHSYEGAQPYSYPWHLAHDEDSGYSLVAENCGGKRVVLLDEEMKFVKELIPDFVWVSGPSRLCLDRKNRRLLVADERRVVIFDLELPPANTIPK